MTMNFGMVDLLLLASELHTHLVRLFAIATGAPLGIEMIRIHNRDRRLVHVLLRLGFQVTASDELESDLIRVARLRSHPRLVAQHAIMGQYQVCPIRSE